MKRTAVKSSNIASVGYDAGQQLLEVQFLNGAVWQYPDCPLELHDALMKAKSIGGFFAGAVRPRLQGIRIEETKVAKQIDILIDGTARMHVEYSGFVGNACFQEAEKLKQALSVYGVGAEVIKTDLKDEVEVRKLDNSARVGV